MIGNYSSDVGKEGGPGGAATGSVESKDSDSGSGSGSGSAPISRRQSAAERISRMDPATLTRKKNEIRAVFRMFDQGGDGSIEAHEIVKLLKATGWQGTDEEAQAIL